MRPFHQALALLPLLLVDFSAGSAPQAQEPFRVSVNVDLVVLNATVRDHKGQFATGLRAQDFEVYEDGVRQTVQLFRHEDIPVTVGLVIDHSGSMRPRLPDVIDAARTFVRASNPADEIFVVNFNDHVTLGLPKELQFSDRVEDLETAISHTPTVGQTALYDAMVEAEARLRTGTRDKKVLIVVSDGSDNVSKHTLDDVLKITGESAALVYTIGIFELDDPEGNPRVLKRLALSTGGEAFISGQGDKVVAACERIARDIRHQYVIGYVPVHPAQAGAYRAIRVVAKTAAGGKLSVRARSGYNAGVPAK